jgi:Tol biopolymer transport system component
MDLVNHKPRPEMVGSDHKVNHLMYSPQGSRFVFVHRWIGPYGKFSRLYVANADGSGLKMLLDHRMVSHYNWRDEKHLLVWARTEEAGDHYYLLNVLTGQWEIVGQGVLDVYGDGHPSFSPDRRWVITDTYPDRARQQHLLLYKIDTNEMIELGRFLAPLKFTGASRCDLHPRWSPDGKMISIDSAHEGKRGTYILDISAIVEGM